MALTNAQRKQAYREKIESMGVAQESIYVHNEDKQALRIYAARLRQARGCALPTDGKILDDLPAPADSQILAALPVQTALVDPTIAQSKINGVAAVVARFEADYSDKVSKSKDGKLARWDQAIKLLRELKEKLS
jgi:hypothetical protein